MTTHTRGRFFLIKRTGQKVQRIASKEVLNFGARLVLSFTKFGAKWLQKTFLVFYQRAGCATGPAWRLLWNTN